MGKGEVTDSGSVREGATGSESARGEATDSGSARATDSGITREGATGSDSARGEATNSGSAKAIDSGSAKATGSESVKNADSTIMLRLMQRSDIPFAMRLKEAAGWNQLPEDWDFLIRNGSDGNMVAMLEGQPAGTVTTLTYGDRFSWIGMVLVDPGMRRRGVGTHLLKAAIDKARRHGDVLLDATPEGKLLYETIGFVAGGEIERLERSATKDQKLFTLRSAGSVEVRPISEREMEEIIRLDREVFGADRSRVLHYLWKRAPHYAWFLERAGSIIGYCFGRPGSRFDQIGPLVAEDREEALVLLERALVSTGSTPLVMDVFSGGGSWPSLLKRYGFRHQRRLIRMSLKSDEQKSWDNQEGHLQVESDEQKSWDNQEGHLQVESDERVVGKSLNVYAIAAPEWG